MARFTVKELDALTTNAIQALSGIEGLGVDLIAGTQQRANMISAHSAWVATLDRDVLASADWHSDIRSNFDLYAELRINEVPFRREPQEPSFTMQDVEAMSDEAIMVLSNHGGIDLVISDQERDSMLRAHAAWVQTLDFDVVEAYRGDQSVRSNWEIYTEVRMNGASYDRPLTQVITPSISAGL